MRSLIKFWKKDIINKMIVVVLLALAGMTTAIVWMAINMPQGRSVQDALAEFMPTKAVPTVDLQTVLTPNMDVTAMPTATFVVLPTFTLPPPTAAPLLPTQTPELPAPTLTLSTQTSAPVQVSSASAECIPANPPQTGQVVEVLDGNTIRVLIDKLVYVVRYTGVEAPENPVYAEVAKIANSGLVYGREIVMFSDVSDKDSRGRLLRYVMQGDTFINQTLIQQGLGTAFDLPPDSACAAVFSQAEQTASDAKLGIWTKTP